MSQDFFAAKYRLAARVRAGKEPETISIACCAFCRERISQPLHCSACHATRYCSISCQKRDWKGRGFTGRGHKIECPELKTFLADMDDVQVILKQFPWCRADKEGKFDRHLALALRSVLGEGPKFGWWSQPLPDTGLTLKSLSNPSDIFIDTHGRTLLSNKHFDEESGWKLPAKEIPWLTFSDGRKPPSFPPVFEHNWTSYYKWRGLPLESPAAMLLHWPLTVYRLLYLLRFVPSESETEMGGSERRKLNIHLIGVDTELNCLPVFGELALLFPNTDIEISMFGPSTHKITRHAKPSAIAAQKYAYEYRAPDSCGSGSIRIQLYKESATWDPVEILSPNVPPPDAMIGLNAGMSAFDKWHPVFAASRALSIPFAVTDFNKICLTQDRLQYKEWAAEALTDSRLGHEFLGHEKMHVVIKSLESPPSVSINPFMHPGHTGLLTTRLPAATNGFACVVTPRPQAA